MHRVLHLVLALGAFRSIADAFFGVEMEAVGTDAAVGGLGVVGALDVAAAVEGMFVISRSTLDAVEREIRVAKAVGLRRLIRSVEETVEGISLSV